MGGYRGMGRLFARSSRIGWGKIGVGVERKACFCACFRARASCSVPAAHVGSNAKHLNRSAAPNTPASPGFLIRFKNSACAEDMEAKEGQWHTAMTTARGERGTEKRIIIRAGGSEPGCRCEKSIENTKSSSMSCWARAGLGKTHCAVSGARGTRPSPTWEPRELLLFILNRGGRAGSFAVR